MRRIGLSLGTVRAGVLECWSAGVLRRRGFNTTPHGGKKARRKFSHRKAERNDSSVLTHGSDSQTGDELHESPSVRQSPKKSGTRVTRPSEYKVLRPALPLHPVPIAHEFDVAMDRLAADFEFAGERGGVGTFSGLQRLMDSQQPLQRWPGQRHARRRLSVARY